MSRPNMHITSPKGWLNDPCAPSYDPKTDLYHLFYQCNPIGVDWGNMSWGHATSRDLIRWKFAKPYAPIQPGQSYDKDGIFTGCMTPPTGDHKMEVFYSSICALPFHWTDPAARGTAGLSMATSTDGGMTWMKAKNNPILPEEPEGLKVTGFRDPYLAAWPSMDRIRGEKSLYGLISGGIQKKGPTSFLYAVDPEDRSEWKSLGSLVDMPERFQPLIWECNYGINWECVNFMTLTSSLTNASREFLILGSEGDVDRDHMQSHNLPDYIPPRTTRHQQWMCGDLVKNSSGQIRLQHKYGGILDHGIYYAANSFHDTKTNRRIVYGWIPEEDCSAEYCKLKGWNGSLAFAREVYVQTIANVVGSLRSPLSKISSIEVDPSSTTGRSRTTNTKLNASPATIHTLGVKPISKLSTLQNSSLLTTTIHKILLTSASQSHRLPIRTSHPTWSLSTTVSIPVLSSNQSQFPKCKSLGLHIRQSKSSQTQTTILFDLLNEKITVDRSKSLSPSQFKNKEKYKFNLCPDSGPFTLFRTRTSRDIYSANKASSSVPDREEIEEIEKLNITIISDGDILELFVNDRFALATMVYTIPHDSKESYSDFGGIELFALPTTETDAETKATRAHQRDMEKEEVLCLVETLTVYDGLYQGKSLIGEDEDWAQVEEDRVKTRKRGNDGSKAEI